MAKYGSDDITVEVDNSSGTPVDITAYVNSINGVDIEAITEDTTVFGDSWQENAYVGVKKANSIQFKGFYDDTADSGPDAVLNALGDTRTVTITYGNSKSSSVEAIIAKYVRTPGVSKLTEFECDLTPTGAVTEA